MSSIFKCSFFVKFMFTMFTFCGSAQKVGRTTYDMPEAGGSAFSIATAQRDLNKRVNKQ